MHILVSFLNPGLSTGTMLGALCVEDREFRVLKLPDNLPQRSGITGLAASRDCIYAILQVSRVERKGDRFAPPALLVFDRVTLTLRNHHPLNSASDVHSICLSDDCAYVVSTGTDEVLELRMRGSEVVSESVFWRPEPAGPRADIHHLNGICLHHGDLLVSGFGKKAGPMWDSAKNGFIANISRRELVASTIHHPHSVVDIGGQVAYCESANHAVQVIGGARVEHLPGYARGLCVADQSLFVGTSAKRRVSKSTGRLVSSGASGEICGVSRVSVDRWQVEDSVDLTAYAEEIYDLVAVAGNPSWPVATAGPYDTFDGTWRQYLLDAQRQIENLIPAGESYVLADEARWDTRGLATVRRHIPFLERDGEYWGAPPDDVAAVTALERLRLDGARYLVVGWPAFWWLDHYAGFHEHLRTHFRCIAENERLVAFDLTAT